MTIETGGLAVASNYSIGQMDVCFLNNGYTSYDTNGWSAGFTFEQRTGLATSKQLMRILKNGNVGIGTTTPAYKLDVNGEGRFIGNVYCAQVPTTGNHLTNKTYVDGLNSSQWIGTTSIYFNGNVRIGSASAPTVALDVTGAGKFSTTLGVAGATTLSDTLSVTGATTLSSTLSVTNTVTAQSFNSTSDYRIKENVTPLKETVHTVDRLRPVHYYNTQLKKEDMGFIAHEVQEEFPFLVSGEKDGKEMQSINYSGLIGLLVKEIQTLKTDNQTLKDDNQTLKNDILTLRQENATQTLILQSLIERVSQIELNQ
jgi:FtsZ-binding cell division protein ZapB